MANLRLILNNSYTVPEAEHSDLSGADTFLTIKAKTDSDSPAFAFAQDITFTGQAYQIIRDALILSPNARLNSVFLTVIEECCQKTIFKGKITAQTIDYCIFKDGFPQDCAVKCSAEEATEEAEILIRMRDAMIAANFDNGVDPKPFQYRIHPYIRYCNKNKPTFIHHLWIIFGISFALTIPSLVPVVFVVGLLLLAVNALCSGCINDDIGGAFTDTFDFFFTVTTDMQEWFVGCGEGALSPFVRSYIQNGCDQCGLKFQSSILNDPASDYYNLCYFHIPSQSGDDRYLDANGEPRDETVRKYFDYNAPLKNLYEFLEDMRLVFNAEWWVKNGVLYFEPKNTNLPLWVNFADFEPKGRIINLCFKYTSEQQPSYARFEYQMDFSEGAGNEAKWLYNDIVDYNIPFNANLRGKKEYALQFGMARFVRDGVADVNGDGKTSDPIAFWNDIPVAELYIKDKWDYTLYCERGQTSLPKLLIYDTNSSPEDGKIMKIPTPNANNRYWYNYPMWFVEGNDNIPGATNLQSFGVSAKQKPFPGFDWNLYRFFHKEDPRNIGVRLGVEFTLQVEYTCDELIRLVDFRGNCAVILPLPNDANGNPQTKMGIVKSVSVKPNLLEITGII